MKRRKHATFEESVDIPIVTVRKSYLRIFPKAQERIYAETERQIDVMEDEGQFYIAVLPELTNREGGTLHQANGTLQTHSSMFRELPNGNYTVGTPEFDEQKGVDWFELIPVTNE